MTRSTTPTESVQGIGVQADGIYALADFAARMHVGRHWLRSARKAGLKVCRWGGRSFVLGSDFVAFLASQGNQGGDA